MIKTLALATGGAAFVATTIILNEHGKTPQGLKLGLAVGGPLTLLVMATFKSIRPISYDLLMGKIELHSMFPPGTYEDEEGNIILPDGYEFDEHGEVVIVETDGE